MRQEIKWSTYRKVPILMVNETVVCRYSDIVFPEYDGLYKMLQIIKSLSLLFLQQQLNDSSVIISALKTYLVSK